MRVPVSPSLIQYIKLSTWYLSRSFKNTVSVNRRYFFLSPTLLSSCFDKYFFFLKKHVTFICIIFSHKKSYRTKNKKSQIWISGLDYSYIYLLSLRMTFHLELKFEKVTFQGQVYPRNLTDILLSSCEFSTVPFYSDRAQVKSELFFSFLLQTVSLQEKTFDCFW